MFSEFLAAVVVSPRVRYTRVPGSKFRKFMLAAPEQAIIWHNGWHEETLHTK